MSDWQEDLVNRLSMNEMVGLQNALSQALVRRFQRSLALVFTDVVRSTSSTEMRVRFESRAPRRWQPPSWRRLGAWPLSPGARVGRYEIGALVGAGGMGAVNHARHDVSS